MKKWILFLIIGFVAKSGIAQSAHQHLRTGDKAYTNEDYTAAEENYRKSLVKKNTTKGTYNLGNAIYQQQRYEEAVKTYESAAQTAQDDLAKAHAYHNLGNAYFNQQQFDKSIEAYKNALRLHSTDIETKKNLAIAQQQLRRQQEQQRQQQQQQQDQQKEQQQQPEQQQQQQQNQQQSSEQEQPQNLSKEEARKLLEIMEQEEQKTQQKLRKAQTKPNRSTKDW